MNTTEKLAELARWNFEATDDAVLVCRNNHDKALNCAMQPMHPAEVLQVLNEFRTFVLQTLAAAERQQADQTLRMLANRARALPHFPMGYHLPELFALIGEEPPEAQQAEAQGEAVAWPSGIDIADEIDSLLPVSMGYSTKAAVEVWWRDLVARKFSKLTAPAPQPVVGGVPSDEHLMNFLAPWCISDDPQDQRDFLAALRAALAAPQPTTPPAQASQEPKP